MSAASPEPGATPPSEAWFDHAFGPAYDALYAHRDDADARTDVDRLVAADVSPAAQILDLGCGAGRHLAELQRRGFKRLVGLDRSAHLIARARTRLDPGIGLVRGDLRALPFADRSVAVALSLFTSFGYFSSDAEHALALTEIRRVLVPGGRLHLDHIDRATLARTLVRESVETCGALTLRTQRHLSATRIEKIITSSDGRPPHLESVRVWSGDAFATLIAEAGFSACAIDTQAGRMRVWATR